MTTVSSFVSLLDRLKRYKTLADTLGKMSDSVIPLRVHKDVVKLASDLVEHNRDQLLAAADTMFMPAESCWFEWPMGDEGDMGILFFGHQSDPGPDGKGMRFNLEQKSVRSGEGLFYAWRHNDEEDPTCLPLLFDLERGRIVIHADLLGKVTGGNTDPLVAASSLEDLRPAILAFLALINSPKIVRRDPSNLERLNRKRAGAGRYTYHPHHCVRLNVDRKMIRVGASDGGDGASRALHHVRAHLRLWEGRYILVSPHWRGNPQVGIRRTTYEIDRQNSTWAG